MSAAVMKMRGRLGSASAAVQVSRTEARLRADEVIGVCCLQVRSHVVRHPHRIAERCGVSSVRAEQVGSVATAKRTWGEPISQFRSSDPTVRRMALTSVCKGNRVIALDET